MWSERSQGAKVIRALKHTAFLMCDRLTISQAAQ